MKGSHAEPLGRRRQREDFEGEGLDEGAGEDFYQFEMVDGEGVGEDFGEGETEFDDSETEFDGDANFGEGETRLGGDANYYDYFNY